MKAKSVIFAAIGGLILITLGLGGWLFGSPSSSGEPIVILGTSAPPLPTLDPDRVSSGQVLYAQYCATCHGVNLEGAPNWKTPLDDGTLPPPPHDSNGHTWHHTDALLLEIVANGGDPASNSRMPSFKKQLRPTEMMAILDFIKSKWGQEERRSQWWMTATQY